MHQVFNDYKYVFTYIHSPIQFNTSNSSFISDLNIIFTQSSSMQSIETTLQKQINTEGKYVKWNGLLRRRQLKYKISYGGFWVPQSVKHSTSD